MRSKNAKKKANPGGKKPAPQNHTGNAPPQIPPTRTEPQMPPPEGNPRDAHQKKHPLDYATFVVEVLGLLAVLAYAGLTLWSDLESRQLVKTAQDTYNAVDRPYVGIDMLKAEFVRKDQNGKIIEQGKSSEGAQAIAFNILVKNFGSVPGEDFYGDNNALFGGKMISGQIESKTTGEIFPGETVVFPGHMGAPYYSSIMSGKSTFELTIHLTYSYAGKRYDHCETEKFVPSMGSFISLGVGCYAGWNK